MKKLILSLLSASILTLGTSSAFAEHEEYVSKKYYTFNGSVMLVEHSEGDVKSLTISYYEPAERLDPLTKGSILFQSTYLSSNSSDFKGELYTSSPPDCKDPVQVDRLSGYMTDNVIVVLKAPLYDEYCNVTGTEDLHFKLM